MDRVYLDGFSTTAGYLQQAPVTFSPKLTCIIGARGTCKSTLVESIRFCLNLDEPHTQVLLGNKGANSSHPAFRLITETLGAGTARTTVTRRSRGEESSFSVERDVHSESRVYRDTVREHANLDILECFEIYSQGDLQRIADGYVDRLGLIDRPNIAKISGLRKKRKESTDMLRSVGGELKTIRAELLKLETELRAAVVLEEQLAVIQRDRPKLSAELEASRAAYLNRRSALSVLNEAVLVQQQAIDHLQETRQYDHSLSDLASRLEQLGQEDSAITLGRVRSVSTLLRSVEGISANVIEIGLLEAIDALTTEYELLDESYYALQKQQNEVNDSIKREDNLRRQIEHMNRQREKAANLKERQAELLRLRAQHRSNISFINETIYDLRLEQIE